MSKPKFRASEKVVHNSGTMMRVLRLLGQTVDGKNVYQCISPSDAIHEVYEENLSKIRKGRAR